MTKAGNFTIKVLHNRCFPNSFTNFLRTAIDMLLTNLLLISTSGDILSSFQKYADATDHRSAFWNLIGFLLTYEKALLKNFENHFVFKRLPRTNPGDLTSISGCFFLWKDNFWNTRILSKSSCMHSLTHAKF